MEVSQTNQNTDKIGIILSALCLAHCMLLPLLSYIAPSLTVWLEQEWIHKLLLFMLVPIALYSFVKARSKHKKYLPLVVGVIGVAFLLSAILSGGHHHEHDHAHAHDEVNLEAILTLIGSVTLIIAHIINIKTMRLKCR